MGAINISDDLAVPEQTQGSWVTANLFDVLRQPPLLGRGFVAGDERRDAEPVVIIGYDIWKNRFDRDPSVARPHRSASAASPRRSSASCRSG